jgi:hypothetical protein
MTAETRAAPVPDQYRPVLPDRGPGRYLRAIAGVRENLLDWVPEERSRYTRLGFIILNTGIMAGISLFVALHELTSAWWGLAIIAVLWAVVITTLDGWLIASTHGVMERKKRILATRLAISLLMGAFIAEPLVLWVFSPAIKGEIVKMHEDDAKAERSQWVRCNPTDVSIALPENCKDYGLNIVGSPRAVATELQDAKDQRTDLENEIKGINAHINDMQKLARDECNGKKARGLSGVVGEGPNCRQARRETEKYRTDSKLTQKQKNLLAADQRIAVLTRNLKDSRVGYEDKIKNEIDVQVAAWRAGQNDKGILDQDRALRRLANRSGFVVSMEWLLRLLLITIDISPVLAKAIQRDSAYDSLHRRQVEAAKKLHEEHINVKVKQDSAVYQVASRETDHERDSQLEQVADADRSERSRRQAEVDLEVERLAAEFRNRPSF